MEKTQEPKNIKKFNDELLKKERVFSVKCGYLRDFTSLGWWNYEEIRERNEWFLNILK